MSADFDYIQSDEQFLGLVDRLADEAVYAVDTEFHREKTYFPHVAVIQIADSHGVAVVDALTVDLAPLARVLDGPGTAIMHAARQDMEVLDQACGTTPSVLVDTQLTAGFLGYTSPSLANLLERELGVKTAKADRLTDWLKRPLTDNQLAYAAADVADLIELHDSLWERVEARGRTAWVMEACEELRTSPRGKRSPEDAWRRIKEIRHLKGSRLATAQAVAAWREDRAATTDLTPRFVLSDLGVVSVSSSSPKTLEDLRRLRGVDGRALKGSIGEELLEVVSSSRDAKPTPNVTTKAPEMPSDLRPVVPLIAAWANQQARTLDLEASLLAKRADLEELLRGMPDARLSKGWRAEIVGEPIRRLVAGEVALAFDQGKGLVLVDR